MVQVVDNRGFIEESAFELGILSNPCPLRKGEGKIEGKTFKDVPFARGYRSACRAL